MRYCGIRYYVKFGIMALGIMALVIMILGNMTCNYRIPKPKIPKNEKIIVIKELAASEH